jgi:osmotically-inducible protein OsmY
MYSINDNVMTRVASLAVGVLFIAGAQQSFAQQKGRQPDQRQQQQMDPAQQGPMPAESDRQRWDITDEAVESLIFLKLVARPGFNNVDVEVQDGVAHLSGKVASDSAESRAMRIAGMTVGVRQVRDQLDIDKSLLQQKTKDIPDRDLAQQVARKIAADVEGAKAGEDWWFDGWRVEGPYNRWNFVVEVDDGRVTLEGEVPDLDIMRKAVEAATAVPGVRSVDTDLRLEHYYARYPYQGPYGYYPYGYYPHAYYPYYGPYAFTPHMWDAPESQEQPDRQAARMRPMENPDKAAAAATSETVANVTIAEIADDPAKYEGRTVTVVSEVEEVLAPRAFKMDEDALAAGGIDNDLIVLSAKAGSLGDMDDQWLNDKVRVTGKVHRGAIVDIERKIGWDLDPAIEVELEEERPVLIAESIERVRG